MYDELLLSIVASIILTVYYVLIIYAMMLNVFNLNDES
jgi:hypothetical protein